METAPPKGHQWLQRLAGEWTSVPAGATATTPMTLGYDPLRGRYVADVRHAMKGHT